ncbi:MAG TPA: adenylate/guanylate cyclase domain-containing protein [bacterium]|mgnify:FL=1|nr:adenylate/guanylate cyclase domain-containing protein [bacterium]
MKKIISAALIAAIALAASFGVSKLKFLPSAENTTFDIRQVAFPPETSASDDIVMIWIDEKTISELPYRSPVPRDFLAKLNERLISAGAKIVGYDIFFKGPSFPEADSELAESLKKSNSLAVVPMRQRSLCHEKFAEDPAISGCVDLPDEIFMNSLNGIGLADLPFSAFDSTVREAKLSFITDLGNTRSFAAVLYEEATGDRAQDLIGDPANWKGFGLFTFAPFYDSSGKMAIRFAGPPSAIGSAKNPFKIFSAKMVVSGLIPDSWLKNKIVLIGAAYDDATDAYLTPYYGISTGFMRMYGVEIHANILSSLLTKQFYYVMTSWQGWMISAALVILISLASTILSPLRSAAVALASAFGWIFVSVIIFKKYAIVAPIVTPIVAIAICYLFGVVWKALTEGRERKFIKGVFSRYVPPAIVDRIVENPELIKLGGDERVITSMFTDIASFTSISEKLDPSTLVSFLNEYLGRMNDVLFEFGATLDKYEGDAIIAFFNAPLDVANHEIAAASAAIRMKAAEKDISEKWSGRCGREIRTRIGINTGPAVIGNMGSEGRLDYTAIGDTINLASRLEGTNKFYGTHIIASQSTAAALSDSIVRRPVDRVRVKGKNEPILIYEIIGFANELDPARIDFVIAQYLEAFKKFEQRDFSEAKSILQDILTRHPDDFPSVELLKRCERGILDPSWDLVTDISGK